MSLYALIGIWVAFQELSRDGKLSTAELIESPFLILSHIGIICVIVCLWPFYIWNTLKKDEYL